MAAAATDPLMSPAGYEPTAVATSSSATLKAAPTIATLTPITPAARLLLSTAEVTALITRGDRLLGTGDVVSARLFYERAADVGDGEAALKLGKTFDPVFLSFGRLSGVRGDPAAAIPWYRRARDLGQAEAEIHLKRLDSDFLK
jgi:TPR repeat protein